MRTLNKYIAGISTAAVLLTSMSCKKDFYTEKNVNPNGLTNVAPNTMLGPIEVSLAYTQGGDLSRFASMFVQQTTGASRQAAGYYQYILTNQDIETPWDNMYTNVMKQDKVLMNLCSNGTLNGYKGISEVLMAYSLQVVVDCWGNVPYSTAFNVVTNIYPTYDKDVTLYANAIALCNQGIKDLNNTTGDVLSPGSDDVVYSGNTANWIKFAHAVLARLYMHQSQTGSGSIAMADSALAHVTLSFASNADNAQVVFGLTATNAAPWYQYMTDRGDISLAFDPTYSVDGVFFQMLSNTQDPRKFILVDSASEWTGNIYDGITYAYYQQANSPVEFICYDEMQFIAAEATLRSGGSTGTAQTDYTNGIQSDIAKVTSNGSLYGPNNPNPGMSAPPTAGQITTYLAQPGIGTLSSNVDSALAQIANQQYIALYLNPEAWVLWRRSTKIPGFPNGSPVLSPVAGPYQSDGIPRRFLYPQSEITLNAANVPSATEWSPRVFWDN